MRAEEHAVEARKRRAEADARRERERDDDCLLRVLARPVVRAEEADGRGGRQTRRAHADVCGARGALVILLRVAEHVARTLARLLPRLAHAPADLARDARSLARRARGVLACLLRVLAHALRVLVQIEVFAEALGPVSRGSGRGAQSVAAARAGREFGDADARRDGLALADL